MSRMKKILKEPSDNLWIQLVRYALSGLSATFVDFFVLTLLTELCGERLLLLWTAIAFLSGLAVTYLLSIGWVFDSHKYDSRTTEILLFVLIGVVGLGLTELLMWICATKAGLHYLISKLIAGTTVFIWNFTAKKLILFRN